MLCLARAVLECMIPRVATEAAYSCNADRDWNRKKDNSMIAKFSRELLAEICYGNKTMCIDLFDLIIGQPRYPVVLILLVYNNIFQ